MKSIILDQFSHILIFNNRLLYPEIQAHDKDMELFRKFHSNMYNWNFAEIKIVV